MPVLVELDSHADRLAELGFVEPSVGVAMTPPPVGPATRYNVDGRYIVHRDRDKIAVDRDVYVRWLEWHGPVSEEVFGVRSRTYWVYPRTHVPGPGLELRVVETAAGTLAIATDAFVYEPESEALLHAINVLLELFGECTLLTDDLEPLMRAPVRRLNWELLRPGERDPAAIRERLEPALRGKSDPERRVAEHRLEVSENLGPNFAAIGIGGFRGYIVFGFPDRSIYVMESLVHGNATYIFGEEWETLSQRTKTEVLDAGLALHRIVHSDGWELRLRDIVRQAPRA